MTSPTKKRPITIVAGNTNQAMVLCQYHFEVNRNGKLSSNTGIKNSTVVEARSNLSPVTKANRIFEIPVSLKKGKYKIAKAALAIVNCNKIIK